MIDVSEDLRAASLRADEWPRKRFKRFLREFARLFPYVELDWDEDVPEGWARFFESDRQPGTLLVVLRVDWPLAFVVGTGHRECAMAKYLWHRRIITVTDSGWDEERLTCDPAVLASTFSAWNCVQRLGIPDPAGFSLSDFWYATVT